MLAGAKCLPPRLDVYSVVKRSLRFELKTFQQQSFQNVLEPLMQLQCQLYNQQPSVNHISFMFLERHVIKF